MKGVVVKNKEKYQIISYQKLKKPSFLIKALVIFVILLGILFDLPFFRLSTYPSLFDAIKMTRLCSESYDFRECYGSELSNLVSSKDLTSIQERLWLVTTLDKKAADCHLSASKVAFDYVVNNPDGWQTAFRFLDPNSCDGGYLYGVLEGLRVNDRDFDYKPEDLEKACESAVSVMEKTDLNTCSQNLGAIILVREKGDIRSALENCTKLSTEELQENCQKGAFKEYFSKNILSDHKIVKSAENKVKEKEEFRQLCLELAEKEPRICLEELGN